MDLQSFIQSGLLEAYAGGQCSAAERAEVERMAAEYPEVRAELDKIEAALEKFAQTQAVQPPAHLRDKILEKIGNQAIPQDPAPRTSGKYLRLFQAAAAIALLAVAGLFWQNRQQSSELASLQTENRNLQEQLNACVEHRKQTSNMMAFLRDSDTHAVKLTDGKAIHITVFNNDLRKECALDVSGLPLPLNGLHFQFWAIVDGKPVSRGMIDLNAVAGWQSFSYLEGTQAYAVSQEKNPQGNPYPTFVIASGNVVRPG